MKNYSLDDLKAAYSAGANGDEFISLVEKLDHQNGNSEIAKAKELWESGHLIAAVKILKDGVNRMGLIEAKTFCETSFQKPKSNEATN